LYKRKKTVGQGKVKNTGIIQKRPGTQEEEKEMEQEKLFSLCKDKKEEGKTRHNPRQRTGRGGGTRT